MQCMCRVIAPILLTLQRGHMRVVLEFAYLSSGTRASIIVSAVYIPFALRVGNRTVSASQHRGVQTVARMASWTTCSTTSGCRYHLVGNAACTGWVRAEHCCTMLSF